MFKVLFIKNNIKELEDCLNKGWTVMQAFGHPQGVIFMLGKK